MASCCPTTRRIIALLPTTRQNLLFSATFPDEIRGLVKSLLKNPAEVQVAARNAVAELVTHVVHPVAREKKRELLSYLIQTRNLQQVLVFCGTRIGANRLAHQLRKDRIQADAIHGDKSQAERLVALENFKAGKTAVLVATDVASRGLDIEGLPQVINFDIPHSPEDYVHRIGRTGRAGSAGEAISLVATPDLEALAAIERLIKKKIDSTLVPGFQPDGGTVATLVSRDRRPPRRVEGQPAPQASRAPQPSRAPRPIGDPIFSRPYEPPPEKAGEAPKPAEAQSSQSKRRQPQVAALLGGLKRA
jgi:ATP-dependent RNA helicase RhlE